jgi:hypothetical protein
MINRNTLSTLLGSALFGVALLGLFVPRVVSAQEANQTNSCPELNKSYGQYAYAEFDASRNELNFVKDEALTDQCRAEKYMLLGALDVIAYLNRKMETLDEADNHFKQAILIDPFRVMPQSVFPPLLMRSRFEMNRFKLTKSDLQFATSTVAPNDTMAVMNAARTAVESLVEKYFTEEHFQTISATPELSNAIFSPSHSTKWRIEKRTTNDKGVLVESAHLIDRNRVLKTVNTEGVLFDIEKPYVRLDIQEIIDGDVSTTKFASAQIKQALQAAGFTVIDETIPNTEAHILIRGHIDASTQRLAMDMGYGGTAISDLTMRWADGSNYEFGTDTEKMDGKGKTGRREAAFAALESISGKLSAFIKDTCVQKWNDRMMNGAVHLIEVEGGLSYDDFRKVLTQISTFALNDPLDNPRYNQNGRTQIYLQYRPKDGDLANIVRREGFYNLSKQYTVNVTEVAFNHIVLNIMPQ